MQANIDYRADLQQRKETVLGAPPMIQNACNPLEPPGSEDAAC